MNHHISHDAVLWELPRPMPGTLPPPGPSFLFKRVLRARQKRLRRLVPRMTCGSSMEFPPKPWFRLGVVQYLWFERKKRFDDILDPVSACQVLKFCPSLKGKHAGAHHPHVQKQIHRKLPPAINPMISFPLPWQKPICRTSSSCLIFKSQLAFLGFEITTFFPSG